uniref:Uncharacterized protein n=1 Tax=Rhizobium phage IG49 TaxID=3129228 RepID=A0AAU8HYU7_9CAUD
MNVILRMIILAVVLVITNIVTYKLAAIGGYMTLLATDSAGSVAKVVSAMFAVTNLAVIFGYQYLTRHLRARRVFKKITSKKTKRIVWWTNKYVNSLVEQEGYTRAEAVEIAHFELISSIEEEFKKKFKSDFEE